MEAIVKAADDLCIALHAEVMRLRGDDSQHGALLEFAKQHVAATQVYMVCFKLWMAEKAAKAAV